MKFGPVPIGQAAGAILAHAVSAGGLHLRKAHLLTDADIAALAAAGIAEVIVAMAEPGDMAEDDAATAVADALRAPGMEQRPATTGRVNLHAAAAGIFSVRRALVDAVNAIDPAVTLATLPENAAVEAGQMVATVKIIPFAVPAAIVQRAVDLLAAEETLKLHAFRALRVGMAQTELPTVKGSVLDKTVRITSQRLARSGSQIVGEKRTAHDPVALAGAIRALAPASDLLVLFGASAVSDTQDVLPDAIRLAGGTVERVGMPVDPGNLLVLGSLDGKPVLGAPGCARSPKENGFDWVLDRLVAGMPVSGNDIAGMGVGGLLMEIATRPQPREPEARARSAGVHAVVLAAGRSSRMGGPNKLLASFEGEPLVRRTSTRALASKASGVTVVTGHQATRVNEVLVGLEVGVTHNPDFGSGLASSLRAGVAAVPGAAAGMLVLLGDMPEVSAGDIDRLIAAFAASGGTAVVRAAYGSKRGNPVILPRRLFAGVMALQGDTGARQLIDAEGSAVIDIEIGEAALIDVDTPEAMRAAGGVLRD